MQILVNGSNLSSYLKSIEHSLSVETHENTSFDSTAKTYVPGLVDATLNAEGFFSAAVGATDEVFSAALGGTKSIWNWPNFGFEAYQTEYNIDSPAADLVSVTVNAQSNVGREKVETIVPLAVRTASGEGSSFDNLVSTPDGGVGYLQIISSSGTLVVTIEDSADGLTWAPLATFGVDVAQRVVTPGTIRRYVRAVWTITGAFEFFVGFGRH